jgi:hypothetical protein
MVLACLVLLLLAFMTLMSFGVSNSIHERIRLQSHADAVAFSTATLEARALNSTAYSNRAIAATVVTMLSVHAWMNTAGQEIDTLYAAHTAFAEVAKKEPCPPTGSPAGGNVHCLHRANALAFAMTLEAEARTLAQRVRAHDVHFNATVEALSGSLETLHSHQRATLATTHAVVSDAWNPLVRALTQENAPHSTPVGEHLASQNAMELACALDGADLDCDDLLFRAAPSAPTAVPLDERSRVLRNAADAARTQLEVACGDRAENSNFSAEDDRAKYRQLSRWNTSTPQRDCAKAYAKRYWPTSLTSGAANLFVQHDAQVDFIVGSSSALSENAGARPADNSRAEFVGSATRPRRYGRQLDAMINHCSAGRVTLGRGHDIDLFGRVGCEPNCDGLGHATLFSNATGGKDPLGEDLGACMGEYPAAVCGRLAWDGSGHDNSTGFWAGAVPSLPATPSLSPHQPGLRHDGFRGLCLSEADTPCFVSYRGSDDPDIDFNQPSVYAGVRQDLSMLRSGAARPWELNETATAELEVLPTEPTLLEMGPRYGTFGEPFAFAVAKAKVYFHELDNARITLGDWRAPPNLFDPFWRAKLHPFRVAEKIRVLSDVGDSKGAALLESLRNGATDESLEDPS